MHNNAIAPTTTIYCFCDDLLRAWGHKGDPQSRMSTPGVMTVALVAAALPHGNSKRSRYLDRRAGRPRLLRPYSPGTGGGAVSGHAKGEAARRTCSGDRCFTQWTTVAIPFD